MTTKSWHTFTAYRVLHNTLHNIVLSRDFQLTQLTVVMTAISSPTCIPPPSYLYIDEVECGTVIPLRPLCPVL